ACADPGVVVRVVAVTLAGIAEDHLPVDARGELAETALPAVGPVGVAADLGEGPGDAGDRRDRRYRSSRGADAGHLMRGDLVVDRPAGCRAGTRLPRTPLRACEWL